MTSGKPLLGVQPAGCLRVLLINLEDTRKQMDLRIAAAMKHFELRKSDIGGRLFVMAKRELKLKLVTLEKGELQVGSTSKLIDFMKTHKIDVLSVDPLRKTHLARENDNGDMGLLIEVFENIAEEVDCAVHIWHHNRKGSNGETTMDSARGASALIDAPRSAEILETMPKQEANKLGVEPTRRRFHFCSYNGKLNGQR
jgi:RecA-family ATPase